MDLRKGAFYLVMGIAILGGLVIGAVPFLVGLILGLVTRKYSLSRMLALSVVTILFILSWSYGGLEGLNLNISLHDSFTLGGKSPLWMNAIWCLFFTVCGGDLAKSIDKYHEKNRAP